MFIAAQDAGASKDADKPGASKDADKPGASKDADKPGTPEDADKPGTSKDADKPGTSDDDYKPGTSEDADDLQDISEKPKPISEREKRALRRGKVAPGAAIDEGGKKQPGRDTNPDSLEVAAWLRNIDEVGQSEEPDPPGIREIMGLSSEVYSFNINLCNSFRLISDVTETGPRTQVG